MKRKFNITLEVEVDVPEHAPKKAIREYIWSEVGHYTMHYMCPGEYFFLPAYKQPKFKVKSTSIQEL